MSSDSNLIEYIIDQHDLITSVSSGWDGFALENDAEHLVATNVIGRSLWEFVSDRDVQNLYLNLVNRLRLKNRQIRFKYRCDSPDLKRFMGMTIQPLPDKSVKFISRIERVEKRRPVEILKRKITHADQLLRMCSWCKKVSLNGSWLEIETALSGSDIFSGDNQLQLTHTICEECYNQVLDEESPQQTKDSLTN